MTELPSKKGDGKQELLKKIKSQTNKKCAGGLYRGCQNKEFALI